MAEVLIAFMVSMPKFQISVWVPAPWTRKMGVKTPNWNQRMRSWWYSSESYWSLGRKKPQGLSTGRTIAIHRQQKYWHPWISMATCHRSKTAIQLQSNCRPRLWKGPGLQYLETNMECPKALVEVVQKLEAIGTPPKKSRTVPIAGLNWCKHGSRP